MKHIAFIFSHLPHGSSGGREGLDALLATSALNEDIGVFFISDGIFQLLPNQQPGKVLARDYISTFGLLSFYDIGRCFICIDSLINRGFNMETKLTLKNVLYLNAKQIRQQLATYHVILTF